MWYTKELNQVFNELNTRQGGLTEDEANKRLEKYGANNLKEKKKESLFIKFIKQFNDFMIIVLIIAAIISAIVAKTNGSGDYIDSIIIIAIVIFNLLVSFSPSLKDGSLVNLPTKTTLFNIFFLLSCLHINTKKKPLQTAIHI